MRPISPRIVLLATALFGSAGCSVPPGAGAAKDAAGKDCAAKLSPEASLVYRAAALDMRHDTDLSSLLRERVMVLVFTDQLDRGAARPAAEQAAVCLERLRH